MSEIGDDFKFLKEVNLEKKEYNRKSSLTRLDSVAISYKLLNKDTKHYLILDKIDYYPTTGYWKNRETKKTGRGVKKLINHVRNCVADACKAQKRIV